MSDQPDPLAAVLAEMRREARSGEHADGPLIEDYASRIEAAAERERAEYRRQLRNEIQICDALATTRPQFHSVDDVIVEAAKEREHEIELAKLRAPGNAAAMRAALEKFLDFSRRGLAFVTSYRYTEAENAEIEAVYNAANAALSAPARNCDRTKDEAEELFKERFGRPWTQTEDELAAFLFAPAEGDAE